MKRMIINADDFGLSRAVNDGILDAARNGILTSATIMANGPAFDDAIARAKTLPELGIGVHLNILRGHPVAAPDPLLLDAERRFHGGFLGMRTRLRTPHFLQAARTEYRAQIARVLAAGIRPTHLDSEKHHAAWPALARVVDDLAAEFGIPAVRVPAEPVVYTARHLPWNGMRRLFEAGLLSVIARRLPRMPAHPDHFFGQTHIGAMTEAVWLALAAHCPNGVTEVMVHPGRADAEEEARTVRSMGASWINATRSAELAALLSPAVRTAIDAAGIERISFAALKG